MTCKKINDNISLKPHQEKIIDFFMKEKDKKGIILSHGMGSGKTLTSLILVKCLMINYPSSNVFVVTPKSLIGNYQKEMKKVENMETNRITIVSYDNFINRSSHNTLAKNKIFDCKDNILVIDEAHNFRNSGFKTQQMIKCTDNAKKVILLTATPMQNSILDIINLMRMVSSTKFSKTQLEGALMKEIGNNSDKFSSKFISDLFDNVVSYHSNSKDGYPSKKIHEIRIEMPFEYYKKYTTIQDNIVKKLPKNFEDTKDVTRFLNGIRRGSNVIDGDSPKIKWIIDKITENINSDKKTLVYSNYKSMGITMVLDYLISKNIPFSYIDGDSTMKARDSAVSLYNNNATKLMLITSAGGEGLDLLGTQSVIITEPHWNNEKLNQVMGRAVRYKSHSHLPENKRHVDIYKLLLVKPPKSTLKKIFEFGIGIFFRKPREVGDYFYKDIIPSADELLLKGSVNKDALIALINKKIITSSIENSLVSGYKS